MLVHFFFGVMHFEVIHFKNAVVYVLVNIKLVNRIESKIQYRFIICTDEFLPVWKLCVDKIVLLLNSAYKGMPCREKKHMSKLHFLALLLAKLQNDSSSFPVNICFFHLH